LAEQGVIQTQDLQLLSAVSAPAAAAGSATAARQQQQTETSFTSLLEEKQRELIQQALEQARYNKTRAAKLLGISFRALRYRLKKLGLDS
ncbi:MAG: helix-turn-helix domain-containing protein, partial [Nevskiales bacterium]